MATTDGIRYQCVPQGEFTFDIGEQVTDVRVSTYKGVTAAELVAAVLPMQGVRHRQDKDSECIYSKISGWQVFFECQDDATAERFWKRVVKFGKYNGGCIRWQRAGII